MDCTVSQFRSMFRTAFAVGKGDLSLEAFEMLCTLQTKNGLALHDNYNNGKSCLQFLRAIAQTLRETLAREIMLSPFFSILVDGSTTRATNEMEMVYVR